MVVKSRNIWLVRIVLVMIVVKMRRAALMNTKWSNELTTVMEVGRIVIRKTILTSVSWKNTIS